MSKQFFIVVIVVLVLAAITGYFGYTKLLSQTARPQQQTTAPQSSVSPFSEGSLKNLFGQNNVTCEINYPDNSGKGTVYVAEKKVRVDASMKVNDKETATHIIQNGDFMYMWTDGSDMGTKIKFDVNAAASAAGSEGSNQAVNFDQKINYHCSNWSVDQSKFTPPADIKFTDLSSALNTTKSSGAPKVDASVCDQIQDPATKASCLKAISQ